MHNKRDFTLLLGIAVIALSGTHSATARPQQANQQTTQPASRPRPDLTKRAGTVQRQNNLRLVLLREQWRKSMVRAPRPKKGCFQATYPDARWHEVACSTPPKRPYPPRSGVRPQIVGNGVDFSGQVTGNTTQAEGSFDSLSGVTSETGSGSGTADDYSLQLNTNFFHTQTCSGAPTSASCQGWEQFVYANPGSTGNGQAFIQYWMIGYGNPCPSGWNTAGSDCWRNSTFAVNVPAQAATSLGQVKLDGAAAGVNGATDDLVTLTVGATLYSRAGDNYFTDLSTNWNTSEFNVFGNCCSSQANFNAGSTIVVRTAVNSGMPATPPTCVQEGFTGETNNLTLVSTPSTESDVNWPSIIFVQSNAGTPTAASCASADSIGDTHLKTFNGTLYDFQASGEFVLASAPNFVVQARQASGAPAWPNASVNKAIATAMEHSRVALYIEPLRLVVDGRLTDLPDGKTLALNDGVQISRRANVYFISSASGNSVRATVNSTWIDATIGLGHTPQPLARGLLGNPSGPSTALLSAGGGRLTMPVAFSDLYHGFADGWRVPPNQSLFTEATTIRPGIPTALLLASHLNAQDYARSRAACKAQGVTAPSLLDACTLDHAVLKDDAATRAFVQLRAPRTVIRPVLRR